MINFVDRLNSEIPTLISEKDCLKLLRKYITKDLYENHSDLVNQILIGFPKSEQSLHNILEQLFIRQYVNHNQHGCSSSVSQQLDNEIRRNLPQHFQSLQLLSTVYKYIRNNRLYG